MSLLLSSASVTAEFFSQRRRRGAKSERGSAMASCSLGGASNIKHFCFPSKVHKAGNIGLVSPYKITCSRLESPYGFGGIQKKHEPSYTPVFYTKHYNLTNPLVVRCASSSAKNGLDAITEEERSTRELTTPGSSEVKALLIAICDTTSIAEVELNIAGLRLYVKRSLVEKNVPPPAPILTATQMSTSSLTPESNGSASTASLAIYKPQSSYNMQRILDTPSDEGLVIIQSPRVGFFRRSRTIKGKRAPPPCKEKQLVREGQVICYVEQLGSEIPIESDVSGEVVKILRYDGEPIGYGDSLISILPSFPGIKKLQ